MKIDENGKLVATDEEMTIVSGIAEKAVDTFIEKSGINKPVVPAAVINAQGDTQKTAEPVSFEAQGPESMTQKSVRLEKASIAISGGDLAVVNAPKEIKTLRFFKAMRQNDVETLNALSGQAEKAIGITAASAGAPLIPVEFETDLLVALEDYSLSGMCTNYTMNAAEKDLRSVTAKPIVYQVEEGIAKTQGVVSFDNPKIYAKNFTGLQVMSEEFFEDNNVDGYQQLVGLYAEALGARRDSEIVGTGATFTGILKATGLQTVTLDGGSYNSIAYKNIVRLTNSLTDGQKANGDGFIMHRLVFSAIGEIVDTNGRPIIQNPWDAKSRTLLGRPVKLTEAAPSTDATATGFVVYGNLKWVAFGRRKGMTAKMLTEATVASVNLAEQGALALMITERYGVTVAMPTYLAKIMTAA